MNERIVQCAKCNTLQCISSLEVLQRGKAIQKDSAVAAAWLEQVYFQLQQNAIESPML